MRRRSGGSFEGGQVQVVDADLGGHELVQERTEESSKDSKPTLAHGIHAINLINATDDLILLLRRR